MARPMKKKVRDRDSAIIINAEDESFLLISSQTIVSSQDTIAVKRKLDDKAIGSIYRGGFDVSLSGISQIRRNQKFDGMRMLARNTNTEFNYKNIDGEVYEVAGLQHPSSTVAPFSGGYSSRDGCFIVSCNNKNRRVCYFAGRVDRGFTRLTMHGFPTTVAKTLHGICTAYPELMPNMFDQAINEYDEHQTMPVYGQFNSSIGSTLSIEVNSKMFVAAGIAALSNVIVRMELPRIPDGTCVQQVVCVLV